MYYEKLVFWYIYFHDIIRYTIYQSIDSPQYIYQ